MSSQVGKAREGEKERGRKDERQRRAESSNEQTRRVHVKAI